MKRDEHLKTPSTPLQDEPGKKNRSVLVTGGAGYIGSHTCLELLNAGYTVTVFDNYSNSSPEALNRVEQITGKTLARVDGDIRDQTAVEGALKQSCASAVLHFAGLKAVGESAQIPLHYYDNNVVGTMRLLQAMQTCNVETLVFSSSATVYGEPQKLPITEIHPLSATNPYGQTKLDIENILRFLFAANSSWRIALLRYFNPVGAHPSGLIGEDPKGIPNNLMPYIAQVAVGHREYLHVFGGDYPTHDGTGIRDYIHVLDLANGHVRALEMLEKTDKGQCTPINLGTGIGHSVLDVVKAFETACGKKIPYKIQSRRIGDTAANWADPTKAKMLLNWNAHRTMQEICNDAWRWQSHNPKGYPEK